MNKIRFTLNSQFYDKETVKEAIIDFKEVCDGKILNDEMEIELEPKEEIAELKGEFCNYVLGLMKNKTLV